MPLSRERRKRVPISWMPPRRSPAACQAATLEITMSSMTAQQITVLLRDHTVADSQPPTGWRLLRTLAAACMFCVVAWLIAVVCLWAAQSRLVFMTGTSRADTAAPDSAIFHQHSLLNAEGSLLNSVLLTHDANPDRYWILFCPPAGASTRVRRIQEHLQQLWTLGYNVFAFDYRGFGANSGTPSEDGLYWDAIAAYENLTRIRGVPASRVILAGRSLGSAVAVDLATRVAAGGLLLFAPIDSVPSVGARLYPWAPVHLLTRYGFDNRSKAQGLDLPVILIYGFNDSFVPISEARSLLREFRGLKLMVETSGGHHHSGFITVSELYRALNQFWPPEGIPHQ
jgi:pimeloyl-ACP methyl ester carboxylesterase